MTNGNIGWTAQSKEHSWVEDHGEPGQTFAEHQLPHPEVQRAAGINPDQYRAQHGLWLEESDQERPAFTGTETGRTPEEVAQNVGTAESFASEPGEYPEEFYVSQYHGGSTNGVEYPKDGAGHILDNLHERPIEVLQAGVPVEKPAEEVEETEE